MSKIVLINVPAPIRLWMRSSMPQMMVLGVAAASLQKEVFPAFEVQSYHPKRDKIDTVKLRDHMGFLADFDTLLSTVKVIRGGQHNGNLRLRTNQHSEAEYRTTDPQHYRWVSRGGHLSGEVHRHKDGPAGMETALQEAAGR